MHNFPSDLPPGMKDIDASLVARACSVCGKPWFGWYVGFDNKIYCLICANIRTEVPKEKWAAFDGDSGSNESG